MVVVRNRAIGIVLYPLQGQLDGNDWWLFLHSRNDQISSHDWNSIKIKKGIGYVITYEVKTYHLLESPYSTGLDYKSRTEFTSQEDCIRKCKIMRSVSQCQVIGSDTDVFEREQSFRFANESAEIACVKRLGLNQICHKQCHQYDCHKQFIDTKIIGTDEDRYKNTNLCAVGIVMTPSPKRTYTHKPSTQPIEFMCFMASTLSIWFGFSMLSIYRLIRHLCMLQIRPFKPNFILNNWFVKNTNYKRSKFKRVQHIKHIFLLKSNN